MWKTVNLGDIADVSAGNSAPQDKFLFEGGTHPFVRTSDVGKIKIGTLSDSNDKLNEKGITKLKLFRSGTILFPKSGASTLLNHRVILDIDAYVSSHLATIKSKLEVVSDKYLWYFLQTIDAAELVVDSAYPSLNIKTIQSISVALPPLAEQERIVAKLDAAFAEIDENMKILKFKQDNVKNLQSSLLSSSLDVDDNIWKTSRLGDVIENGETTNPTINPDTLFSYIDISSIDRSSFRIAQTHTLLGKDAPSRARRLVRKGDVLFATTRPTLQRIAIISEDLDKEVCSTGFIVLRPTVNLICSKFIFYFMLSEKVNKQMEELQTGASYPAVNDTQVKNLCISFPPLAKQERIVTKLDTAYIEFKNVNESIAKSIANYQALKSAILFQELQSSEAA